ncbi:dihydroorotase [Geminicoccus roseus]|uniref:dihydroorotase n=1 Tax=Geminicoccus roseus TaxID=404900 RepID=UPI0003FB67B7|nr:dihydroorotase [Geminicoccus roseus]
MQPFDLVIRGGKLVTPAGIVAADLGVRAGKIAAIGALHAEPAASVLEAEGLHVLPGVIDSQVHFREPGLEHKEDLATGSDAAVLGGVTTVFEMPNTNPNTISAAALADKLDRAAGRMRCDHAFYVGATAENIEALPELERLAGSAGIKIFMGSSTGSLLVEDDASLERVLRAGFRRVAVHAEDEPRLRERKALAEASGDPVSHPHWRDVEAAVRAVRRLLNGARTCGRRVHVLHITSAEEMELLAEARDVATVEVTPHHLTMHAPDCYERLGTRAQMNPPVRDARHQAALWKAIQEGVVDVLGSDHAPHTLEEKNKPYPSSPSGMTGVQTLLPVMLDHVAKGRLSLERLVDLTGHGPQRIFQLVGKGRIMRGYDADLVLVDLQARWRINTSWLASRAGWSPYEDMEITGRPVSTLLRGAVVAQDGELIGKPVGRPVRFMETLAA